LNAEDVIENTFSPVEGGPIMEQPVSASAATAREAVDFIDISSWG
jgi:hypothetical protein